jgi:hypothetical protein
MPKVIPNVFTYEQMQQKWSQDIEEGEDPYTRRSDLQSGRYALDKWLIRVDDEGKTLAVIGWKEHPQHTVCGGGLTTERGKQIRGNMIALMDARKAQIPQDKMMVTALVHRSGDNSRWLNFGRGQNYRFPGDKGFEEYANQLPPEVKEDWLNAYPETFGVKPVNPASASEEVEKIYYDMDLYVITKNERYIRELGSDGYNVLDTNTNKRMNTYGLSKSQAKDMLQALKEGRSVWEYIRPQHNSGKSRLRKSIFTWKNILKVLPPSNYRDYAVPEKDNTHTTYPPKAYDYGTVRAVVRGHYLSRVAGDGGHGTSSTDRTEIPIWVKCFEGKSQGKYWMYRKADENNYEIILVDVYTILGSRIAGTTKDFNRKTPTFAALMGGEEQHVTKLIVFTNYFNSITLSQLKREHSSRARVDCIYTGEKSNHPKGQAIQQKKKPDGPSNIFSQNRGTPSRNKQGNNNRGRKKSRNQQGRNKEAEFQRRRRR